MGKKQRIKIKKGLDLPITGVPEQRLEDGPVIRQVAILGPDYLGMRPTMLVQEGSEVKLGQVLFEDKKNPGVCYTSPASGKVAAINRGAKRSLLSVVIDVDGDEEETFDQYRDIALEQLNSEQIREKLLAAGLWTALRTRPFSKVPTPASTPQAIFVTAIETDALGAKPELVIEGREDDFIAALTVLAKLTDGSLYLCTAPGVQVPGADLDAVNHAEFEGPHPAGLPGTHIHFLASVGTEKAVWHLNYQDALAIGALFRTGRLDTTRVVALGGPQVNTPRLLRTRQGAQISALIEGELAAGNNRIISGSALAGRTADGVLDFLGRYHLQVTALAEGGAREFLGWQAPGADKFSVKNVFVSALMGKKRFPFNTLTNGSPRAMVPIGSYEKVMPLDILPTQLLRALIVGDVEQAQALGCLELDEEDLSLCTFVCPGKTEYGPLLRQNLERIEKEG
jgi:Na+-transporting NADH:ubiquinone oxidoreductase subunit A